MKNMYGYVRMGYSGDGGWNEEGNLSVISGMSEWAVKYLFLCNCKTT
jgi:hypothetical protein